MATSDIAVGSTVYAVKRDQNDRFRPHEWTWEGPLEVLRITQHSDGFFYDTKRGIYRWEDVWGDEYGAKKEADRRHNQEMRTRMR